MTNCGIVDRATLCCSRALRSAAVAICVTACSGGVDRSNARSYPAARARDSAHPIESDDTAQIRSSLSAFLLASLASSPATETDSLMSCVPDGQTDRYVTLARFQLAQTILRDTTAVASAIVWTVAEEVGDPHKAGRYVSTLRVRLDTLRFKMKKDLKAGTWGVCGYPKEGFGFGHYGNDLNTGWTPTTASWRKAQELADSVSLPR